MDKNKLVPLGDMERERENTTLILPQTKKDMDEYLRDSTTFSTEMDRSVTK